MKRNRSLALLAAVAVVMAALVWWDRRRPSTEEAARQHERILPGFDRAAATEITVDRAGVTTQLRHEASGWWLVAPRRRADDGAVEALLAVLEEGQIERRLAVVDEPLRQRLGLAAPRARVHVAGRTLTIGGDDPSRGVYLMRDGEPGALVAEHRLVETADLDPRLWRSMRLGLREPADAARLAYGESWALERRGGWRVTRPVATRAADAKVDALVQSLSRARAVRELAAAPAGQGDGVALLIDGAVEARLGGACPGAATETLVARADGAWLCFRTTDLNLVRAPATTFYERRLFPLRLDDIVAADVGALHLRREQGSWRIVAPPGAVAPARDEAVRAWLEPLLAAEARSYATAPPGAGTRVRLATSAEELIATVDGARARRAGETVTLELVAAPPLSADPMPLRAAGDLGAR